MGTGKGKRGDATKIRIDQSAVLVRFFPSSLPNRRVPITSVWLELTHSFMQNITTYLSRAPFKDRHQARAKQKAKAKASRDWNSTDLSVFKLW